MSSSSLASANAAFAGVASALAAKRDGVARAGVRKGGGPALARARDDAASSPRPASSVDRGHASVDSTPREKMRALASSIAAACVVANVAIAPAALAKAVVDELYASSSSNAPPDFVVDLAGAAPLSGDATR